MVEKHLYVLLQGYTNCLTVESILSFVGGETVVHCGLSKKYIGNPYTNTNKEKFGSFFSRALAYVVKWFSKVISVNRVPT